MKQDRLIFVAYDIKDDKVRGKISRRLLYYGLVRIQFSLFRGYITTKDKSVLENDIRELVNEEEDKIHIIEICESCRKNIRTIGDIPPPTPQHLII
ncbi:MAG: CRISPR-associated endonuclease Cas2 [Candidatus Syntrophoarchaeum sp.]|nr:CRISPR-associated endonuclease Cas2 [Candidatus Syntrophoarchaeum sp.]